MLLLASTSDKLQLDTSSTADTDVHASVVDRTSTTDTHVRLNTAIGSATTTDIVTAPAASTYRNVRHLTITNRHASTNVTVTLKHTDGTTVVQLYKSTLLPGYQLTFKDGRLRTFDGSGMEIETARAGVWQGTTFLATTGTFTTGPYTNTIVARGVGGGAGGGGSTSVTNGRAGAGGGGAGGYAEKTFAVSPNTQYSYTCGAQGNGVSAAAGGNGTDSTFVVGATTVTAKGGTGGPQAVAANALSSFAGGAGGTISTNGDLNAGGAPGRCGHVTVNGTSGPGASGSGGNSPFGVGGVGRSSNGNGNNAIGFGAGGGGSCNFASVTARTGGNGTAGCWVVEEFS